MSLAPQRSGPSTMARVAVLVAAGLVLILGAKFLLTRPASFSANGISLNYPKTWQKQTGSFTPPAGIDLLWTQGFTLDFDNGAGVAAANIGTAVPEQLLEAVARQNLEPAIRSAVEAAGGSLTGPAKIEISGRTALSYEISGVSFGRAVSDVSLAAIPSGTIIYFIACQKTPEHAEEVDAGCQTIRESFTIGSG